MLHSAKGPRALAASAYHIGNGRRVRPAGERVDLVVTADRGVAELTAARSVLAVLPLDRLCAKLASRKDGRAGMTRRRVCKVSLVVGNAEQLPANATNAAHVAKHRLCRCRVWWGRV